MFIYTLYSFVLLKIANQHKDMQMMQCSECEWEMFMSMNAFEEMLARNADASYPDAI